MMPARLFAGRSDILLTQQWLPMSAYLFDKVFIVIY